MPLIFLAGLMGFAAVALGAFGAHALSGSLSPEQQGWWSTAGAYLLPHAVAVLFAATSPKFAGAGWSLGVGALIFAGTLYAMALGAPRWFGAITPIGGVLMLIGWLWIMVTAFSSRP
ncbi:MAG: DUF423 domain-containing protein [Parvularcula sp.]